MPEIWSRIEAQPLSDVVPKNILALHPLAIHGAAIVKLPFLQADGL